MASQFPHCVVFGGKLIFQKERWYQRFMHNQSVVLIQNRLQWEGIPMTHPCQSVFLSDFWMTFDAFITPAGSSFDVHLI